MCSTWAARTVLSSDIARSCCFLRAPRRFGPLLTVAPGSELASQDRKSTRAVMLNEFTKQSRNERGFSLLEMMLATVILLVGLVAIAQLVPATILLNFRNRTDSSSLVFAQRELDQMLDQPLTANSFLDAQGNTCQLGDPTVTNSVQGTNVLVFSNQAAIDFTSSVSGYNFIFKDEA